MWYQGDLCSLSKTWNRSQFKKILYFCMENQKYFSYITDQLIWNEVISLPDHVLRSRPVWMRCKFRFCEEVCGQIHQHFTHSFIMKDLCEAFLYLQIRFVHFWHKKSLQKLLIKCWWNRHLESSRHNRETNWVKLLCWIFLNSCSEKKKKFVTIKNNLIKAFVTHMTFFTNNIAIRIDYENLIILITGQGKIIKNEQCKVHYIFKETTLVGYRHLHLKLSKYSHVIL